VGKGTIVTSGTGSPRAEWAVVRRGDGDEKKSKAGVRYGGLGLDSRDPLGLCGFGDEVRRRGYVFVKVIGGVSVLGAVLLAVGRAAGVETGLPQNGWWAWIAGAE
jgi:hypothetical protein